MQPDVSKARSLKLFPFHHFKIIHVDASQICIEACKYTYVLCAVQRRLIIIIMNKLHQENLIPLQDINL